MLHTKLSKGFAVSVFSAVALLLISTVTHAEKKGDKKPTPWTGQHLKTEQLDSIVWKLIRKMSLKEKVNEMHGKGAAPIAIGIVFKGHYLPVKAGGNKRLNIPTQTFTDGPRGVVCAKSTCFPVTMARGASWDVDLEKRVGDAMGAETRAVGVNYSGAICMNVLRNPLWGRSQETYGEDPWLLGEMASSLLSGFQLHNVNACIKHFMANSMENNRYAVNVKMDERTMREVYMPHFKKCIDAGAMSVMSSYNQLNGHYAGQSKFLLTDILRREWGFKGYVTSDWDNGIYDGEAALKAGMNVEMSSGKCYSMKHIEEMLKKGKITEGEIDSLIFPTIRTKIKFASLKDKIAYKKEMVASAEHIALAKEVAEKSAVLLKNDNDVLPLNKKTIKKIAVIGSLADVRNTGDRGSSWVRPRYIVSPLDGIKNYFKGTDVEILTAKFGDNHRIAQICKEADAVIVVVGNTYKDEGEFISMVPKKIRDVSKPEKCIAFKLGIVARAGDRTSLCVANKDIQTIETARSLNPKTVVCMVAGGPLCVEGWYDSVPSILQTFYNGMEGGNALAGLLFGDVNPSGKLPFLVPMNQEDLPEFNSSATEVNYGYYHGYTLFDKKGLKARFPFGYGLSYTSFAISNVKVVTPTVTPAGTVQMTAEIQNTGTVAGAEVAQLYIGFKNSQVDRPVKILRGFKKVFLQPGEKTIVTFEVSPQDLAYYNTDKKEWTVENMEHEIYIGNSSSTGHLQVVNFTAKGF